MALAALVLAGCDSHGAVATQPPKWTEACGAPAWVFSPRAFHSDTGIDIVTSMAADAEVLFFATNRAVYRVPAAGGEPEQLIAEENGYGIGEIWQADGRFLVSRVYAGSKASVWELPRAGTTATAVIDSIPYLPGEYTFGQMKIFWIDEAYVYWQALRPFTQDGKDYAAYPLHRMPWKGTGPVENLAELTAGSSTVWKQGDMLWILDYPNTWDSMADPRLLSLPAAGGAVTFGMNFAKGENLISGDDTSLYFKVLYMNGAYQTGLGRVLSRSGSRVEYLYSGFVQEVWPEHDRLVIVDLDYVGANPMPTLQDLANRLWTVPSAGGAATPIGCIGQVTGSVEARTKVGNTVYMSLYTADSKLNGIARFTLP